VSLGWGGIWSGMHMLGGEMRDVLLF